MKWSIREAIDVHFKAKSTFKLGARTIRAGEPVLILDSTKTSTFEVAADQSYVTGGRGNARILAYEGDKSLSFQFEDALLSAEGMAILAGADLIPARNKRLPGSSPEARSVISHYTEKYAVATPNRVDLDTNNTFPVDPAFDKPPRGGDLNVWLTRKPYVGQNASIYVMLLDNAGEMSGAPVEINLQTKIELIEDLIALKAALATAGTPNGGAYMGVTIADVETPTADELASVNNVISSQSYLAKFSRTDNKFIAFDSSGLPMSLTDYPDPTTSNQQTVFDDMVAAYVDADSAKNDWLTAWGSEVDYTRTIGVGTTTAGGWDLTENGVYGYLVAPSGGVGQPKAFRENGEIVYKVNVPSVLYQDIVLVDYYVEHKHDATQISILPDKFAPYMYVEGSSLVRRASDGMDLPIEFVIPKFKITTALTFTLQSTGDASTFTFQGDAFPDFSKFDLTKKVFADVQILDADDNYDGNANDFGQADPTSYKRFRYNEDEEGNYLWKDPSLAPHSNIDYSDTGDYVQTHGGPATRTTDGIGLINTVPNDDIATVYPAPVTP